MALLVQVRRRLREVRGKAEVGGAHLFRAVPCPPSRADRDAPALLPGRPMLGEGAARAAAGRSAAADRRYPADAVDGLPRFHARSAGREAATCAHLDRKVGLPAQAARDGDALSGRR